MNTMSSIFQSFGSNNKQALPVSQPAGTDSKIHQRPQQQQHQKHEQGVLQSAAREGLRRRLSMSSLYLLTLPISSPSPAAAPGWGSFRRSKSLWPSMAEYSGTSIRNWWDWGWSWILSRNPTFSRDLEMNQEETAALGSHSKGSWRHVFYKLGSELRRMLGSYQVGLPQTFNSNSFNNSNNSDNTASAPTPGYRHPY